MPLCFCCCCVCSQLYGRHRDYLNGLVGSDFEMVSSRGTARDWSSVVFGVWWPGSHSLHLQHSLQTVLLWRWVGSFYFVASSRKLGQKGQVAEDLGSAEIHPACSGLAEHCSLCEAVQCLKACDCCTLRRKGGLCLQGQWLLLTSSVLNSSMCHFVQINSPSDSDSCSFHSHWII